MKLNSQKTLIATLVATAGLTLSPLTLALNAPATTPQLGSTGASSIVQAIKELTDKVVALSMSWENKVNDLAYHADPNFPTTASANTVKVRAGGAQGTVVSMPRYSQLLSNQNSSANVNNSLLLVSNKATPLTPFDGDNYTSYRDFINKNSLTSLTLNYKASDSLHMPRTFSNFPNVPNIRNNVGYPQNPQLISTHNTSFNFGNLVTPLAFSGPEAQAAHRFIQFATGQYIQQGSDDLTATVNLQNLTSIKDLQKRASALNSLVISPAYKKWQFAVRSAIANRSITNSLLNQLVSERTPNKNTCYKNEKNQDVCDVSALQLQHYIATHRTGSKDWYRSMSSAPPSVIQRETLFVLAEIEKQNFQAHIDRERQIAATTAVALGLGSANKALLQTLAQAVNSKISAEVSKAGGSSGASQDGDADKKADQFIPSEKNNPDTLNQKNLDKSKQ